MAMFGGSAVPSLADIAAVTGNNGNNNGGWMNGEGCCQNAYDTQSVVQRGFDNQAVISKLDNLGDAACNLGYTQLQQTCDLGGQITQLGFTMQNAINADTVANMQNTNALSTQIGNCCCDMRAALKDISYDMATQSCATNNNITNIGNAIIQNQNQNANMLNQTINDGFRNLEYNAVVRENNELRQRLNNCDRDAALQGTASYIINSVRPTPGPAWIVDNPWGGCNCNNGFNNGSCCNRSNICC